LQKLLQKEVDTCKEELDLVEQEKQGILKDYSHSRDEAVKMKTLIHRPSKGMSDSQLRARGLKRGNVLKLRSLIKDEEGKSERLHAHRFNSLQQHLRCVGVRDKCILKRFKGENIEVWINHVIERIYDSESCYAGLKRDSGETIQEQLNQYAQNQYVKIFLAKDCDGHSRMGIKNGKHPQGQSNTLTLHLNYFILFSKTWTPLHCVHPPRKNLSPRCD